MKEKRKINAMLIGGNRSGSTWLKSLCHQHPDIFICPVSQKGFFSRKRILLLKRLEIVCPMDTYRGEKVILGRRNMLSSHNKEVPKAYFSHNKNMKFILIVRNPIERCFSGFVNVMSSIIEKGDSVPNFDINRNLSIENPWVNDSLYYSLLRPYLFLFPKDRFLIIPLELMREDPEYWLKKVFNFLNVCQDIGLKDMHRLANPGKYKTASFAQLSLESKHHIAKVCMEDTKKMGELSRIDFVKLWRLDEY